MEMTRHNKMPHTAVAGTSKALVHVPANVARKLTLLCTCHLATCNIFQYSKTIIGGKQFSAGEKLIRGLRCGSVVTTTIHGWSMYGLVKQFLRVVCECLNFHDFAVVTWLPRPTYPDGDPLTVIVNLGDVPDVNNMNELDVIGLYDIEPSRVAVGHDQVHNCMSMMRMEGIDKM